MTHVSVYRFFKDSGAREITVHLHHFPDISRLEIHSYHKDCGWEHWRPGQLQRY